jgi:hypothetical protein
MRILAILFVFLHALVATAQQPGKQFTWEKERGRITLTPEQQKHPEYIVKLYRGYEVFWEDDNLVAYMNHHQITRVTTTTAIERHNRIYVSMRNVLDIVTLKARSINSKGRVTNFDEKNLKEIKDEETDNTYRIFAIEGIEADSEIEFFYTLKIKARLHDSYYFQQETPIRDITFKMVCPKSLVFDFRTYNDTQKVTSDTLNKQNRYTYHAEEVPGLARESFTFYDTYRKRIDYKLAYNFTSSSARLNTWADAGRVFYRALTNVENGTEKELAKFVKTLGDNVKLSPVERIKNVEDKIKNGFRINTSSSDPSLGNVPDILKSHQASGEGLAKLLFMTYEYLKIPVQLVVTCDREFAKFDGAFDSWGFLDEYLLYFPETNGFLVPDDFELRYPLIPRNLSGHKGLFIEPVAIGELKTGITKVREIPALPYTADSDNLDIDVRFADDMESNQIDHKRTFTGYDAASIIPYYETMADDQRKKFIDELFRQSIPDLELQEWKLTTASENLMPKINIAVKYATNQFLEKAGPRILFKAGELIGPQSELYREEARQTPIENTHNRAYVRSIRLTIPKGYKVGNLEALNMLVEYKDGDRVPFSFASKYTMQGNQLVINIEEYYKEIYAPLERYEDFRKVINAAADFNKVTLVFTKE